LRLNQWGYFLFQLFQHGNDFIIAALQSSKPYMPFIKSSKNHRSGKIEIVDVVHATQSQLFL